MSKCVGGFLIFGAFCFLSSAAVPEPIAHKVAREERGAAIQEMLSSIERHTNTRDAALVREDAWGAAAEVSDMMGDLLGPSGGRFKIVRSLATAGGWSAEKMAEAEQASMRALVYDWAQQRLIEGEAAFDFASRNAAIDDFKKFRRESGSDYVTILETLTEETPESADQLLALQIQDVGNLLDLTGEELKNQIVQLGSDVRDASSALDDQMNLLEVSQRAGFAQLNAGLANTQKMQMELLEQTSTLGSVQIEIASRLEQNQAAIYGVLGGIEAQTSSAAESGRLLLLSDLSRKPLQEQVRLLENNDSAYARAIIEERGVDALEQTRNAVKSRATRQNIASTAKQVQQGAVAIGQIANAMGWRIAEKKEFQEAVSYTSATASAVAAIATGNPMGVVSAVGGLLGGGDPPSAGEREILAKLAEMDAKLDTLLQGQQDISDKIDATTKQLSELGNRIFTQTLSIEEQISFLTEASTEIYDAVQDWSGFRDALAKCEGFRRDMTTLGVSSSYEVLVSSFLDRSGDFSQCRSWLETVIPVFVADDYRVHTYLKMAGQTELKDGTNQFVGLTYKNEVFLPLLQAQWASLGLPRERSNWSEEAQFAAAAKGMALLATVNDIPLRRVSTTAVPETGKELLALYSGRAKALQLTEAMYQLVHPQHLQKTAKIQMSMSPFVTLLDPSTARPMLVSTGDVESAFFNSSHLQAQYQQLLDLTSAAYVQQRILSGGIAIPYISSVVFDSTDHPHRADLVRALDKNEILSRNVLTYFLYDRLRNTRLLPERFGLDGEELPAVRTLPNSEAVFLANLAHYETLTTQLTSISPSCAATAEEIAPISCILGKDFLVVDGHLVIPASGETREVRLPLPHAVAIEAQERVETFAMEEMLNLRRDLAISVEMMNDEVSVTDYDIVRVLSIEHFQN